MSGVKKIKFKKEQGETLQYRYSSVIFFLTSQMNMRLNFKFHMFIKHHHSNISYYVYTFFVNFQT
jgi:hypothetical protein